MKIGIIGLGFVGTAVYNAIIDKNKVSIYDKYKTGIDNEISFNSVLDTDIIFLCLPTPKDDLNGVDLTSLKEIFKELINFRGVVVLKSTIHPEYLKIIPNIKELNIISNPEFLTAHNANDDFIHQKTILLGGRIDLCHKVAECYNTEFTIGEPIFEFCTFEEALEFKYFRNMKLAYDVLYTNFIYQNTKDYRKINKLFAKFPVKEQQNINICVDGRAGFGGACLPKDLFAFNFIKPNTLTDYMIKYNDELKLEGK